MNYLLDSLCTTSLNKLRKTIYKTMPVVACILLALISSCKKDFHEPDKKQEGQGIPMVKRESKYNSAGTGYTSWYMYDSLNRVLQVVYIDHDSPDTSAVVNYTYSGNLVRAREINYKNSSVNTGNYNLNSAGYAIGAIHSDPSYSVKVHEYNDEGNVLHTEYNFLQDYVRHEYNYWHGGNCIKVLSVDGCCDTTISNYYFLSNKLNTIGNHNFGKPFLGKSNVNLVDYYFYTFDTYNRVIAVTSPANQNNRTEYEYY